MASLAEYLDENSDILTRVPRPVDIADVGALTAQAGSPVLFESITGYPGWKIADQLFVNRVAQARVLGCDDSDPTAVVRSLVDVLKRGPKPLHLTKSPPCQEIIHTGDDIDLLSLPVVTHTDTDPYPYTTSFAVHTDPETGLGNQMFPRCGVLNNKQMVTSFVTSTANKFLAVHRDRNTPMPQAIVIGAHPAWELAGCYSAPHDDWWELQLFEAITGERGQMANCVTVPLSVPADASVVIEGWIDPASLATDGPSPGPNMLFTPYASQQPVFNVTAITMRSDPIYRNHQMTPRTDHQEMPRLFHEAILFDRLRAMGIGIRDVHFPSAGGHFACILQVEPEADGQVTDALLCALGAPWLNMKMVIAVDPDINIYDEADVLYALASRVNPTHDVRVIDNARATPFDPTATPILSGGPRVAQTRYPSIVGKWAIDATKPVPYRKTERALFERAWPRNWGSVFLDDYLENGPQKEVQE